MFRIAVASVVVIAVIAAFVGIMYLRFSDDTIRTTVITHTGPGVVVAARDIPAGTYIEADMVGIQWVPDAQLAPYAYNDTAKVVGRVAKVSFASGEQVVPSKVAAMPPWGTGLSGPPPHQSGLGVGFGN